MSHLDGLFSMLHEGSTPDELGLVSRDIGHMCAGDDTEALRLTALHIRGVLGAIDLRRGYLMGLCMLLEGVLAKREKMDRLNRLVTEMSHHPLWQAILAEVLKCAPRPIEQDRLSDLVVWRVEDAQVPLADMPRALEELRTRGLVERWGAEREEVAWAPTELGREVYVACSMVQSVLAAEAQEATTSRPAET